MPTLFGGVFDSTPPPKTRRVSHAVGLESELSALLDAILVGAGLSPPVSVEASTPSSVDPSVGDPCPCTPTKMTDAEFVHEFDALLSSTSGP